METGIHNTSEIGRLRKAGTDLTAEQLRAAAATWQVRSGSRSGRTAQQFVNQLDR